MNTVENGTDFFYNDNIFRFLRVLISGQSTDELEASFSVGAATPQSARMAGVKVSLRGFRHAPFKFLTRISLRVSTQIINFFDEYITDLTDFRFL
ncbi:unnamed protein product [Schistosoma margrebowiei]|uniref:Uncharacterized protein n=1 Tax=Schistosoma margrebowiei TaxID=48269 RepID=A0A183MQW1_9TREM|nr:unnamed protein product [Schistosoma margrebowiei]